jgi:Permuted papain-like amidase enzyme, YaeF/YiiX, C92 family
MAHQLTKKQILDVPIRKYAGIRHELKTGDLVFCSGNYFFSKTIQGFTKSVWSHVGVIYKDQQLDRVMILESEVGVGVRLAPLSKYLRDYHGKNRPYKGNMMIGRVLPEIEFEHLKNGISFGLDELTKPYDNWEIIRIAIRIAFKIGRRSTDRKYICSELIQECFKRANISFKYKHKSISPDDIWQDERVNLQYRLM